MIIRAICQRLNSLLFTPIDTKWFDVIRIGLGLALLYEAFFYLAYQPELLGEHALVQPEIQRALDPFTPFELKYFLEQYFSMTPQTWDLGVTIAISFYILMLSAMVIGLFTRVAIVLAFLCHVLIINAGMFSLYGVDQYFMVYFFYMMMIALFSKPPVYWGVERLLQKDRDGFSIPPEGQWMHTLVFRLAQAHLMISYANAGIAKSLGNHWWTGEAIWRVMHLPDYQQLDTAFLSSYPLFFYAAGWVTLILEIGYIPAIVGAKTRLVWVAAIIGLHLGIGLFMGLHLFAYSLIVLNIALFLVPYYSLPRPFKGTSTPPVARN